jgi:hypothetical protein
MSADAPPPVEDDAPSAWVLADEDPRRLKRALRAVRRGAEVSRILPLSRSQLCVELEAAPPERVGRRVARRLEGEPELRLDCDVAWAPVGRGFVLLTVTQPAHALVAALDSQAIAFRDVAWPHDVAQPVRVCLPRLAMADPLSLAEALKAQGIGVEAVYEVGGCRR